jgi:leucyl/phenylalanyl-tRNA--protein transferase
VAVGAGLEPGTVLDAYRRGLFPMRVRWLGPLGWWSPDPRGVIPLDGVRVSRSLARSMRRFEIRVDTAFEAVMRACGAPDRPGRWIDESFVSAYCELFRLGWVHSVEVWTPGGTDPGADLVGGLYGIAVGGLFAGESMFHRATDASKVALVALVERLRQRGFVLLDTQWQTPHLRQFGTTEIPRSEYLRILARAVSFDCQF